jgi:hypothetical protein
MVVPCPVYTKGLPKVVNKRERTFIRSRTRKWCLD